MQNETDKLIQEQFSKLPQNLQQAINAVSWKSLVHEVGKENALDTEQIASLEQETMFIIYGFEPPEDYVANIMREVGITEEAANKIAESVAEKIFEPILTKAEDMKESDEPASASRETNAPETASEIHPMVEKGEVAHDTTPEEKEFTNMGNIRQAPLNPQSTENMPTEPAPQAKPEEQKPQTSPPPKQQGYPGGKDPYREPLE